MINVPTSIAFNAFKNLGLLISATIVRIQLILKDYKISIYNFCHNNSPSNKRIWRFCVFYVRIATKLSVLIAILFIVINTKNLNRIYIAIVQSVKERFNKKIKMMKIKI